MPYSAMAETRIIQKRSVGVGWVGLWDDDAGRVVGWVEFCGWGRLGGWDGFRGGGEGRI